MSGLKKCTSVFSFGKNTESLLAFLFLTVLQLVAGCAGVSSGTHASPQPSPLSITSNSVPSAKAQTAYSTTLTATGGTAPYTWSLASGALPVGLSLSSSGGQISGTPSQGGSASFTIQVKDSSSPAQTATQQLSIEVAAATTPLQITSGPIPSGQVGSAYSTTLAATGGVAPYIWGINSGALPAGLDLNASTGQIGGTPTHSGSYSFVIQVKDSSTPAQVSTQALSATIAAAATPLTITTQSLANGQQGTAYNATLNATGGTTPYTWSISSGQLPPGTSLNSTSGAITGTPTQSGTFYFTANILDSGSPALNAAVNLSIQIAAAVSALQISTTVLPAAATSTAYNALLAATGGTAPYAWSLQSGSLPAGLALSAAGQVSGTPTQNGSFTFTIQAKDASSPAQTASKSFTISVALNGGTLQVTTVSFPSGQAGESYSSPISAVGGIQPYTWSVTSGSLPVGVTMNNTASTINGTPTQPGTYAFTLQVQDSSQAPQTASKSFFITIAPAVVSVAIATSSLTSGQANSSYAATLGALGGTSPYSWSISSGSLPAGLSLTASTGQISGTPTQVGTSSFTVQVKDSSSPVQTATKSLGITIAAAVTPVQITTSSVPSGQVGTAYSTTLAATGGTTPYSWSISSGVLPAGLNIAANGTISGTPTASGSISFTAKVTDSGSSTSTASANFNITIVAVSYSAFLGWTLSTSTDVTGYNVYRTTVSGAGYTKINSSLVGGSTYTDATVVNGQTYHYVVTSVDTSGDESIFSDEVQAVIP
jgi:hypothetical protein